MEETMEKEIFHQVLLHVAGMCCYIQVLYLCRCNWWLEHFDRRGASWCWSKGNAGKSSLVLTNWPQLVRMEMSFKNQLLQQFYWWFHILPVATDEKMWPCAVWLCHHIPVPAGSEEVSAQQGELGLILVLLHMWGDGKGDGVNLGGAKPPPLEWELQYFFCRKNMLCDTRLITKSLGYCKLCKCSNHWSLQVFVCLCVFSSGTKKFGEFKNVQS